MLVRRQGARWQEAQLALQNIMDYYMGRVRSETMLEAGWKHLQDLKARAFAELRAENSHELMRCLEVLNLMDVAEMSILAARERKETRFLPNHYRASYEHYRVDYPETDDENWFRFLVLKRQNGQVVFNKQPIEHII
jgi:succinate dehydrogenase/fumarate reductase flavoprotein subunit